MSLNLDEAPVNGPVLVFYNYYAVPITCMKIDWFVNMTCGKFSIGVDGFFFCCDVRKTSEAVMKKAQGMKFLDVMHISSECMESSICEKMSRQARAHRTPGRIVLISDSGDFGPTLDALSRLGWKVSIFHPPLVDPVSIGSADEYYLLPIQRQGEYSLVPSHLNIEKLDMPNNAAVPKEGGPEMKPCPPLPTVNSTTPGELGMTAAGDPVKTERKCAPVPSRRRLLPPQPISIPEFILVRAALKPTPSSAVKLRPGRRRGSKSQP